LLGEKPSILRKNATFEEQQKEKTKKFKNNFGVWLEKKANKF